MKRRILHRAWLLVVLLLVASMVLPACAGGAGGEIKNPDTFIMATIGDIDSLDPAYAYDTASGEAQQLIYETLIFYDGASTTEFVPMLATEWNMSSDGMTYRFKIREGVKFHNGDDLTPEDVEYTFERGMVQDYGAGPQWMFFEPLLGGMSSRDVEPRIPLEDRAIFWWLQLPRC
jgi:peptide/nickel transport system substrate-binding protein